MEEFMASLLFVQNSDGGSLKPAAIQIGHNIVDLTSSA